MTCGRIWIVATKAVSPDLAERLEGLLDGEVVVVPSGTRRNGLPAGTPDMILFDLRDQDAWSASTDWASTLLGSELVTVPWIGISGECIPLDLCITGDQIFAGFCRWPLDGEKLQRTFRLARKRNVLRGYGRLTECRSVHGSQKTFTTYEPRLFPLLEELEVAARHDVTVLLVAETGTGKSTLAQIIHDNSRRRDARFLTVACASLPRELIESELFGHVKGAFTGADRSKEGKFDAAKGGTILLDEIDALEPVHQAKLLRVLETGEFEPVGSNETHQTTARTIVASNVCLETLVRRGEFRQDLFFRLNQMKFELPPLRERPRDVVPLAVEFIEECAREGNIELRGVDPSLLEAICTYQWPGNIRELRNEVRRCVLFARDGIVRPGSLSTAIAAQVAKACQHASQVDVPTGLAGSIAISEQQAIETMLKTQNYNRAATARALGISRVTLYNKIRRYGIRVDGPEET